jgi:hypothetical protein
MSTVATVTDGWRSEGLVGWTDHDGPGRPPSGPTPVVTTGLGGAMAVVFTGMLATDTLCPEHRVWVEAFGVVALVCTVVASVGLMRRWASAPLMAFVACGCGVAIGLIDSVHAAERGHAIAVAFGVLTLGTLYLGWLQARLAMWDRTVRRSLRSEGMPDGHVAPTRAADRLPASGDPSPDPARSSDAAPASVPADPIPVGQPCQRE